MCEFEWEWDNTLRAWAKCKYCGELYVINYSVSCGGYINIPKYYYGLCKKCEKKVIKDIPKKYKIKGAWRDFRTYENDYKINKYRFDEKDVIFEKGTMEMENFTKVGKIKDWQKWIYTLPETKGVYAIMNNGEVMHHSQRFLEIGTGGYFKDKNPNVPIKTLQDKWYKGDHRVMYIGRANKDNETNKMTIRKRIEMYMRFGNGEPVAHWGGRYIWQLQDVCELDVYFLPCENPQAKERELIEKYKPFANLKGGDQMSNEKETMYDKFGKFSLEVRKYQHEHDETPDENKNYIYENFAPLFKGVSFGFEIFRDDNLAQVTQGSVWFALTDSLYNYTKPIIKIDGAKYVLLFDGCNIFIIDLPKENACCIKGSNPFDNMNPEKDILELLDMEKFSVEKFNELCKKQMDIKGTRIMTKDEIIEMYKNTDWDSM